MKAGKTAAAAGGSMLVRRSALDRIGGIAAIKGELIDDCALAQKIKSGGGSIGLALADETRSLRPYNGYAGVWNMVARTAFHQLRRSVPLLVATVAGMVFLYLLPPIALVVAAATGEAPAAVVLLLLVVLLSQGGGGGGEEKWRGTLLNWLKGVRR